MKKELIYGWHSVTSLLQHRSDQVLDLFVSNKIAPQKLQMIEQLAQKAKIKLQLVNSNKLDKLLPNCNHQGIAAYVAQVPAYVSSDLNDLLADIKAPGLILILDGVQDPQNLGSCLRTANASGVDLVIIPKDNSVGVTAAVSRVASGAAELTKVVSATNLATTMGLLQEAGFWLYGAEVNATVSLYETKFGGSVGLVLGAEGKGMRRLTKEKCDFHFTIPMFGAVQSLNVGVATGICLYEIVRQKIQVK